MKIPKIDLTSSEINGVGGGIRTLDHRNHNPVKRLPGVPPGSPAVTLCRHWDGGFPSSSPRLGTRLGTPRHFLWPILLASALLLTGCQSEVETEAIRICNSKGGTPVMEQGHYTRCDFREPNGGAR